MSDTPPTSPRLRTHDPKRPKKPKPQYGTTHQKLRAELLSKSPLCAACEDAFAVEAHHKWYGGPPTLEQYMPVCKPCHQRIEAAKRRAT